MVEAWVLWLIIVALIFIGAFFNSSETAFASCNRIRMRVKADGGNRTAQIVCKITDRYNLSLITTVIGTNVVSVSISIISTILFVRLMGGSGSVVATISATLVVYLFCDTIPKSLARALPDEVASFNSRILYFLIIIMTPFTIGFLGIDLAFRKIFKMQDEPEITEEDFSNVIDAIQYNGILEKGESEIIQSAIDFGDKAVKDVLTPREKIFGIDIHGLSPESLNQMLSMTNYSRIPIYQDNLDNVIGILHVRNYIRDYLKNPQLSIRSTLGKPYFVTPKVTMDELFEGFRNYKTHIAMVIDPNKKVIGMVTMEDVLEELVGTMDERLQKKGGKK